ncbi:MULTISPECIES: DMT family transporter [unclassified Mesorhizobium]|uniref:DMT family transporter n=1 Tax=unclassified Mesorhizobium TaxID=325217 RepID=UPI0019D2B59A|nr:MULTISPECIES: DMT family transporter [unclassified Mesorhizobium]
MLAMAGGAMMPVQAAMNARLAHAVGGTIWAAAISAIGVAIVLAGVGFLSGPSSGRSVEGIAQVPWWGWCGGCCGALVLFSAAAASPRIGAMTMVAAMVAGQVIASAFIDGRGLLGLAMQPPTYWRVLATILIVTRCGDSRLLIRNPAHGLTSRGCVPLTGCSAV